jgi:hypothetical protein
MFLIKGIYEVEMWIFVRNKKLSIKNKFSVEDYMCVALELPNLPLNADRESLFFPQLLQQRRRQTCPTLAAISKANILFIICIAILVFTSINNNTIKVMKIAVNLISTNQFSNSILVFNLYVMFS